MAASLRTYKLISIAGLANSGKDTAAHMLNYLLNAPNFFRKYFGYKLLKKGPFKSTGEIIAFAKPLKQTLSIILNKPLSWFEDRKNKETYYVDFNTLKIYPKSITQDCLSENKFQKLIKTGEPLPLNQFISIRQLMQYYGTEVIRRFLGDKTGINATLNCSHNKKLIISDLRFRVELNEIKNRNGVCIYISRSSAKPGTHASEKEVIELDKENAFDFYIPNEGTLSDLFYNLKGII